MEINKRFEIIINSVYNGNQSAFAKAIGVTPTVIANVVGTRQGKPSFDVISKICANANISAEWLLTGEGPMLKAEKNEMPGSVGNRTITDISKDKGTKKAADRQIILTENPKEGIPLIPFSAMAGAMRGEMTALEYECEHYVVPAFKNADFLIPVSGNSMQPTYLSGDLVACQRISMSSIFFQWNKPYVLDTAQGAIIKRVRQGTDAQHLLIVSDNTDYEPFEQPLSEIYAVSLVVGIIRLE